MYLISRGITSVAGNQTIERVTGNALKLTAFLGMDIPVARGSKAPLLREIIPAGDIHGETGLGNVQTSGNRPDRRR